MRSYKLNMAASAAEGGDVEHFCEETWLNVVDQNLSPEGFHLMKVLYLDDLSLTTLTNNSLEQARELHYLMSDNETTKDGDPGKKKSSILSPADSLLLFIYRLRILVPSETTELRTSKDVGAQACIDRLPLNVVVASRSLSVSITQKSKALECLVKTYVNLTEAKRKNLMLSLGTSLGRNAKKFNLFEIFSVLFKNYFSRKEITAGIAVFSASLQHVREPLACTNLEENLTKNSIPHCLIETPEIDEFYVPEEVAKEFTPLLKKRDYMQKKKWKKRKKQFAIACGVHMIPILIGLLFCVIALGILSSYVPPKSSYTIETSDTARQHCTSTSEMKAAPIRVGEFSSFWQTSVRGAERADNRWYSTLDIDIYIVPSNQIHIHTENYTCTCWHDCDIFIANYYLLKGSSMNFSLKVGSAYPNKSGHITLGVCDKRTLIYSLNCTTWNHTVGVGPSEVNKTLNYMFIAPNDSYYYFRSMEEQAIIYSYQIDVELKYLNESDWIGKAVDAQFNGGSSPDIFQSIYKDNSLGTIFDAKKHFTIVGVPPTTRTKHVGQFSVIQTPRKLVYLLPVIASSAFMFLGVTLVTNVYICRCVWRNVIRRRNNSGAREMHNIQ